MTMKKPMFRKKKRVGLPWNLPSFLNWRFRDHIRCSTIVLFIVFFNNHNVAFIAGQVPGFKSLDCGASEEYTDPETGIVWVPDDDFITSGQKVDQVPVNIGPQSSKILIKTKQQLTSLRWFPGKQKKHCYTLNVVANTTYLVRGSWYYSNRSTTVMGPLNNSIIFQFVIDLTVHREFTLTPNLVDVRFGNEWIVKSRSTTMHVCLIPIQGLAFINSLELRPMANDMYLDQYDVPACLFLKLRYNLGVNLSSDTVRYPDDKYDRHWHPPPWAWVNEFNNFSVEAWEGYDVGESGNWDLPPNAVMSTAWDFRRYSSVTIPVGFRWEGGRDEFGMFSFYISNLNQSDNVPNITRDFDILMDGLQYSPAVRDLNSGISVQKLYPNLTVVSPDPIIKYNKTSTSTLGPILNAIEAYALELVNVVTTNVEDESTLESLKNTFVILKNWAGDPCLPVPYDWIECSKPSDNTSPRVISVNLSNMLSGGSIPEAVANLPELEYLGLDGNNLTGEIPDLSTLVKLETIHLENNNLNGTIPFSLVDLPSLQSLYLQNNNLCGNLPVDTTDKIKELQIYNVTEACRTDPSLDQKTTTPLSEKSSVSGGTIAAAVGGVAMFVILAGLVSCFFIQRGRSRLAKEAKNENLVDNLITVEHKIRKFTLREIKEISNDFEEIIGKGGFGEVFKGRLANENWVAIKRRRVDSDQSGFDQFQDFQDEVNILSHLNHNNIVTLLGYCAENSVVCLVYEFMCNGTLFDLLHSVASPTGSPPEPTDPESIWRIRLGIVFDAACGLNYLHQYSTTRVIHRDVKSSNILLGEDFVAKMGDFGMSKVTNSNTEDITSIKGTIGYMDPQCVATNMITFKSDVYSFGVVLFEVITGVTPRSKNSEGGLASWARKMIGRGNLDEIVDPRLRYKEWTRSRKMRISVRELAELAKKCTEIDSNNRIDMVQVFKELNRIKDNYIEVVLKSHSSIKFYSAPSIPHRIDSSVHVPDVSVAEDPSSSLPGRNTFLGQNSQWSRAAVADAAARRR